MSCFVMNNETLAALANAVETRLKVSMGNWSQRRLKSWKPCVTYTRTMTLRETSTSLPRTSGLRATDRPTAGICRRP